jgi:hypothetical protein
MKKRASSWKQWGSVHSGLASCFYVPSLKT